MEKAEKQRNQWNYGSGDSAQMMSAMKLMKIAESSAAIHQARIGMVRSAKGVSSTPTLKRSTKNLNCLDSLES